MPKVMMLKNYRPEKTDGFEKQLDNLARLPKGAIVNMSGSVAALVKAGIVSTDAALAEEDADKSGE